MRITRLLLVTFCAAATSAARGADDMPVSVYVCPRIQRPPTVDGRLDDACWRQAPKASGFTHAGRSEVAAIQSSFRVVYDDTAVYFGIRCNEPEMEEVREIFLSRDRREILRQESVEIFFDPGHTHRGYHQVGVNVAGSLYDAGPPRYETGWNGGISVATARAKDGWCLELAIPWRDLGVEPVPGQIQGFNVCRSRYVGPKGQWTTWARLQGTFQDFQRYGHLALSPTAEQMGRLGPELRRGDRTGPVQFFSPTQFGDPTYRLMLEAGLERLDARLAELRRMAVDESGEAAHPQLAARLKEFEAEALAARIVDEETFTRLDGRLYTAHDRLERIIWEARLQALLSHLKPR